MNGKMCEIFHNAKSNSNSAIHLDFPWNAENVVCVCVTKCDTRTWQLKRKWAPEITSKRIENKERQKENEIVKMKPSTQQEGWRKNNKFMFRLCISTDIYNVNNCCRFGFCLLETAMPNFNTTKMRPKPWCAKIIFDTMNNSFCTRKLWKSSLHHCPNGLCCVRGGLFVYLKAEMEVRRAQTSLCLGEMYHHYGMNVIVLYCWANTAVYVFNICLMDRFCRRKTQALPFLFLSWTKMCWVQCERWKWIEMY